VLLYEFWLKTTMSELLGKFLKKFVGPVNVRVARKEDSLKVMDEYNNYRVNLDFFSFTYCMQIYLFLCIMSLT
jgi:hypothetical protein